VSERSFRAALSDLSRFFKSEHQGMIIGGIAVIALGYPRVTTDIDATMAVPLDALDDVLARFERFGFLPRIDDAPGFGRTSHVLLMKHAASGVPVYWALVDMVLGEWDPARYPIRRSWAADLPISADIAAETIDELLDTEGIFRVKLQKLKKTAGRVALRADSPRQLLAAARRAARLCGCNYDCYRELRELVTVFKDRAV